MPSSSRFNPSVGILFCRTSCTWAVRSVLESFNPSVGILFCRTRILTSSTERRRAVSIPRSGFCFVEPNRSNQFIGPLMLFQSLGRDSVLSNCNRRVAGCWRRNVSIPRSGFCFVEPVGESGLPVVCWVSIPRSGFCFVELPTGAWVNAKMRSFNPSVGILFCRTRLGNRGFFPNPGFNPSVGILFCRTAAGLTGFAAAKQFQSLGRDSVLSNDGYGYHLTAAVEVSIPRSGFCFVELQILRQSTRGSAFQSLGRDSVLSNKRSRPRGFRLCRVSIPRSGFCFVERGAR